MFKRLQNLCLDVVGVGQVKTYITKMKMDWYQTNLYQIQIAKAGN